VNFPKPYADQVAKLRVPGGFVLVAAFIWLSQPTPVSLAWGLPLSILGLALRAWAAGHLEKNSTLAERRTVRAHEESLYVGTLTVAAGFGGCVPEVGVGNSVRGGFSIDLFAGGAVGRNNTSATCFFRVR